MGRQAGAPLESCDGRRDDLDAAGAAVTGGVDRGGALAGYVVDHVDLVTSRVAEIARPDSRIVTPGAVNRLLPALANEDVDLLEGPVHLAPFGQFAPRLAIGRLVAPLVADAEHTPHPV